MDSGEPLALAGTAALMISALLTAVYMLSILVRVFFPKKGFDPAEIEEVREPGWRMLVPLGVLAVCIQGHAGASGTETQHKHRNCKLHRHRDSHNPIPQFSSPAGPPCTTGAVFIFFCCGPRERLWECSCPEIYIPHLSFLRLCLSLIHAPATYSTFFSPHTAAAPCRSPSATVPS